MPAPHSEACSPAGSDVTACHFILPGILLNFDYPTKSSVMNEKELLNQILANQYVIFDLLCKLMDKQERTTKSRPEKSIADDLSERSEKFRKIIEKNF